MARIPGVEFANLRREVINPRLASPALAARQAAAESAPSGIGEALEKAGSLGMDYVQKRYEAQEREALAQSEKLWTDQFLREQLDTVNTQRIQDQTNPDGYTDRVLEASEERFNASLSKDMSQLVQKKLKRKYDDFRASLTRTSVGWEAQQKSSVQQENIQLAEQEYTVKAIEDPENAEYYFSQLDRVVDEAAATGIISNPRLQKFKARQTVAGAGASQLLSQGRIGKAKEYIEQNKSSLGDRYDDYLAELERAIDRQEAEAEKAYNDYQQDLVAAAEIDLLNGELTDERAQLYRGRIQDPQQRVKFERIYLDQDVTTDERVYFQFKQRIRAGEDVREELINSQGLSVNDKIALEKMNAEEQEVPSTIDPVRAGRNLFDDLPAELFRRVEDAAKIAVAKNVYDQRISALKPEEVTYEKTRQIAAEELRKVESDYVTKILSKSGLIQATPQEMLNIKVKELKQLMIRYEGDRQGLLSSDKYKTLKEQITALETKIDQR